MRVEANPPTKRVDPWYCNTRRASLLDWDETFDWCVGEAWMAGEMVFNMHSFGLRFLCALWWHIFLVAICLPTIHHARATIEKWHSSGVQKPPVFFFWIISFELLRGGWLDWRRTRVMRVAAFHSRISVAWICLDFFLKLYFIKNWLVVWCKHVTS